MGLLVVVLVTAATVQDRDGGRAVLERAKMVMPSLAHVWADGGYAGRLLAFAWHLLRLTVEIVKKKEGQRTSRSCPGGGWSSGPCPGSAGAGGWTGTMNASRPTPKRWSTGP